MATVTGLTAERMQEIVDETVSGAHITGDDLILELTGGGTVNAGNVRGPQGPAGTDPSIVICTSSTRPTGIDLFEGLGIYETDTDRVYFYNGTAWVLYLFKTPKGFQFKACDAPIVTPDAISSTTGVDYNASDPLDVAITKIGEAAESNILLRLIWSGFQDAATFCASWAGVRISGTDYWGTHPHQFNTISHTEWSDAVLLTGLASGAVSMRARLKKHTGSADLKQDVADFFRIEYEEVLI